MKYCLGGIFVDQDTLKKIEILKERTNLSEEEAKELLEKLNGDLIEALIYFEKQKKNNDELHNIRDKISQSEFVNYIKGLIKSGNVARIIIRKDDTVIVNIPVNAGIVVGVIMVLQPVILLLGAATAVFTKLEIDIIKKDGTVEVVNKYVEKGVETTAKVASEVGHELQGVFSHTSDKIKDKINQMKNNKNR